MAGGQVPSKKNRPDTQSKAAERMAGDVALMRDVAGGTAALRHKTVEYLPKNPAETEKDYNHRLSNSVATGATARTVKGLGGLVLRESITLGEDVPAQLVALERDIDNRGSHLDVFAKNVLEDALEAGHAGILVDMPLVMDAEQLTRRAEAALGVRPYLVHYPKESVTSWRFVRERGRQVLQQLVLYEPTIEPDGRFGEEEIERWRVLERSDDGIVTWTLWEKRDEDYPVPGAMGTIANVTEIPFVAVYGGRKTSELESVPPLRDLAHVEVAMYRVMSDLLQSMSKANNPILAFIGVDTDEEISVGANVAFTLPNIDQDIRYVEHTGAAHASTEARLEAFKHDASVLGMSMLFPETRAPETATARRMDKSEQDSALASAARSLQDALENAFAFMAQMMKLGDDGGTVTVNRDFDVLTIDAQSMAQWLAAVAQGAVSLETFWQVMKEGGGLPDDFDAELEQGRIDAVVPPPSAPIPPDDDA